MVSKWLFVFTFGKPVNSVDFVALFVVVHTVLTVS